MRYYVHYLHFSDYCPHLCPQGYMEPWMKALVRSSDIPKECEFNTQ